jgi:hypothetical protein
LMVSCAVAAATRDDVSMQMNRVSACLRFIAQVPLF